MGDNKSLLTIQHGNTLFSPPIVEGVEIEWERTGSPGKLTFTTIKIPDAGMNFEEGDAVCFYYDKTPFFMGYVFSKSRDKKQQIKVTCYDQIRYLKNKYSYVFEKKTATQIIKALCKDFNIKTGTMEDTKYVIPAIAEENTAALDIILSTLEDTLTNTGNMFTLYDDFGKLTLKDSSKMMVGVLIDEESAENYDYSSNIDDETYNEIVLYYKDDNNKITPYAASNKEKIQQWGTLRYFEEVKTPSIGKNKANQLLSLYCRKKRELKVNDAFGSTLVRAGCLVPVKLDLGDITTNNYMLVEKVTHKFNHDKYTMDLTLEGAWEK